MRGRGRNSIPPCKQIPKNCCNKTGKNNWQCDEFFVYGFADSVCYCMILKYPISYKVEKGCPDNCLKRSEDLC